MRVAGRGDPYDANAYAQEAAAEMQRLAGGNANVNIIHDATSRRASELELADQLRNDMTGGR